MESKKLHFELYGNDMQCLEIILNPEETVIAEAGSLMMMDNGIVMETSFGDGSQKNAGVMTKLIGAGKRLVTGESLFMTTYTNRHSSPQHVYFSSPFPGSIIPIDLRSFGGKLICQKDAFLAASKGTEVGIEFQKKLGVGLFGGEGFIMQKLTGDGMAFVHAGGTVLQRNLAPGEKLRVDTGCLVAMSSNVSYNIEMVKGVKTALFGGEGLFFATLEGPGTVYIQSLPFSRLAARVVAASGGGKGEGSVIGGAFNLLGGD